MTSEFYNALRDIEIVQEAQERITACVEREIEILHRNSGGDISHQTAKQVIFEMLQHNEGSLFRLLNGLKKDDLRF